MGKIRKAILQQEKEALKKKNIIPRKEEEWDVSEEGFYKDDVDVWNEEKEHLLLDPSIEPASYSEDDDDSDTEVLALDLPESENENFEEDDHELSESEQIEGGISDKAWGQRKTSFYDADYLADESVHSSDESLAEEEEREAITLQKRMLESLEHHHYGLDQLQDNIESDAKQSSVVTVSKELSDMTETERFSLLEHQWPEFLELYGDLTESLKYSKDVITPLNESVSRQPHVFTEEGLRLIHSLQLFNNLYCLNVMFYITLRASQLPAEDHPVIKRIIELRDILGKIKTCLGSTDELLDLLENSVNSEEIKMADTTSESFPAVDKKRKHSDHLETGDRNEEPLEFYNRIKMAKRGKKEKKVVILPPLEEEGVVGSDGKRGITYQIAQNKGLTPKRKKEQRNPRVKHRKKYVKAVKRYKKVVRPVESEMDRYGGERGGIKARLSRSVKIK